jgi:hypothetical protein
MLVSHLICRFLTQNLLLATKFDEVNKTHMKVEVKGRTARKEHSASKAQSFPTEF